MVKNSRFFVWFDPETSGSRECGFQIEGFFLFPRNDLDILQIFQESTVLGLSSSSCCHAWSWTPAYRPEGEWVVVGGRLDDTDSMIENMITV